MNARRLTAIAVTSAGLSIAAFAGPAAAATVPDGAVQCVENTKAGVLFYVENGYVQPVPACKPLS
jgi:hypothetical protein